MECRATERSAWFKCGAKLRSVKVTNSNFSVVGVEKMELQLNLH